MSNENLVCSNEKAEFKDVVVIGNGPSAITLSYLLSGHVPYYRGNSSDDFLHLRLSENIDQPLVLQDLEFLSDGLEGRSTNPVSVLFDALAHPDADLGVEQPSLLEWRFRDDLQVDHVVLGKGQPGGAWKMMTDSDLLTVSLGTWMELPDLTMKDWRPDVLVDNRVSVSTVAAYYKEYVQHMSLSSNFEENTFVTSVRRVSNCSVSRPSNIEQSKDIIKDTSEESFNALFEQEYLYNEKVEKESDDCGEDVEFSSCTGGATNSSCCSVASASYDEASNTTEEIVDDFCTSGTRIGQLMRVQARKRANTTCCLDLVSKCNNITNCLEMKNYDLSWNPIVFEKCLSNSAGANLACSFGAYGRSYSWGASKRNTMSRRCVQQSKNPDLWEITGVQTLPNGQKSCFQYLAENVVLATGSYDKPNVLAIENENLDYVVHSLKGMEQKMDSHGPIMIVGAGLSAADAIVAALESGRSVLHVFRRSPEDPRLIFNNLPAAIYPEYHRIHRMMAGKESHPGYKAFPQHHVVRISANHEVTLHGNNNTRSCLETLKVSLLAVLIGASPNLDFMADQGRELGIIADESISRNNLVDIDLFSHESIKQSGIYAMGPLVGDNFVRFLQGGALAITNNVLKKKYSQKS